MATQRTVDFRLGASSLDFGVDVCLRDFGGRWVAVAVIRGKQEIGLGATARDALTAALSSLPSAVVKALLADPQLFDVSRKIVAANR